MTRRILLWSSGLTAALLTALILAAGIIGGMLPDNSVVFSSMRDSDGEILTADIERGLLANLTRHPAYDTGPARSPDGSRIAFVSGRDGGLNLYVMDATGGNVQQLTAAQGQNEQPAWSPDGSQLAFVSDRDGNAEIYRMNADSSNVTRVTENTFQDEEPTWSPDGTQIAFVSWRVENFQIFIIDVNPAHRIQSAQLDGARPLTDTAARYVSPAWSPDGSRIGFASDREARNFDLYTMNPDGSDIQQLTRHGSWDTNPHWSADGSRLWFESFRDGNWEIYALESDNSVRRITQHLALDGDPS